MHGLFQQANSLTSKVIGAAIEVHREIGPGLMESVYERCLIHELTLRGIETTNQKQVSITYKNLKFTEALRFDVMVMDCLLIELKCVERVLPIHKAQLFSYMKQLNIPIGLLINFHEPVLKSGISRLMLPGAGKP